MNRCHDCGATNRSLLRVLGKQRCAECSTAALNDFDAGCAVPSQSPNVALVLSLLAIALIVAALAIGGGR